MKRFFDFERSQSKLAIVILIPTFIIVFGILIFPLLYSFIASFGDLKLTDIKDYNFIGLGNYIQSLKDPMFLDSLLITLKYIFFSVFVKLIFGTLVALMLKEKFIGRNITRSLVIIPWATPFIVTGIIWKWILHSETGVLNFILLRLGLIKEYIPFLTNTSTALPSIVLADVWQGTPFFVIILLAGLQTIPDELYEAATVDGASGIKSFFHITLPLIRPQIFFVIILGTIFAINQFDLFFILTRGGPSNYTTVATLYNWNVAFKYFKLSYASAISYLILIIAMLITVIYIYILRGRENAR